MNKAKLYFVLATAFLITGFSQDSRAQCKSFAKKKCLPQLAPYFHNGQYNSAVLRSGEEAEMPMVFYKGQDYRILVGSQDILGSVVFKLSDANGKELYSSEEKMFDFNVDATQRLTINIKAPSSNINTGIVPSGCIAVLIGFKQDD